MAPSVAELRARFPEFTTERYADATVEAVIADSERLWKWDDEARLFLIAHLLVLDSERSLLPDGGSSVVASERIGARAMTYVKDEGDAFYLRTSFGREFLALQRRHPGFVMGFHISGS